MPSDSTESIIFGSFRRAARPGATVVLTIDGGGGASKELVGVLVEVEAAGVVLETDEGTEFVPANEIVKWRMPKATKPSAPSRAEPEVPAVSFTPEAGASKVTETPAIAPEERVTTSPAPTAHIASTNASPLHQPSSVRPAIADLELLFAGEPYLAHPEPSFDLPILERSMRQDVNRWRDKYAYAMKVKEPGRLTQLVGEVAELAETLNDPAAYCLAGSFAHLSGIGLARVRQYYEAAAIRGSRAASLALAHLAIVQKEWRKAAEHAVQALLLPGNREENTTLVRTLGQCILRSNDKLVPGFGNYLMAVTDGPEKKLAMNLAFIVFGNDSQAVQAITSHELDKLAATPSGAKISLPPKVLTPSLPTISTMDSIAISSQGSSRKGRISTYLVERGFGFLVEDTTGNTWHFYASAVMDDELLQALNRGQVRQYVTFSGNPGHNSGKYSTASGVRGIARENLSLSGTTTTVSATSGKDPIGRAPLNVRLAGVPKDGSPFARAKKAEQLDRLSEAERLYREEISCRGTHVKSAIKDLATLLNRRGQPDAAIETLHQYRDRFNASDEQTSLDQLEVNFRVKARQFGEAAKIIVRLVRRETRAPQKLALQRQEAYCYLAEGAFDKAIDKLKQLLKASPQDNATLLLLQRAEEAKQFGMAPSETVIFQDDTGGDSILAGLALGLSPIARRQLDTCELRGLDARTKERRQFSAKDFQALDGLLEGLKGRRPRERADYQLTMAYLCEQSPEAAVRWSLHESLRRHFSSLAEAYFSDRTNIDVVRCMAVESLALCPNNILERDRLQMDIAWALLLGTYCSEMSDAARILKPEPNQRVRHLLRVFAQSPKEWIKFLADAPWYRLRAPAAFVLLDEFLLAVPSLTMPPADLSNERQRKRDDDSAFAALKVDAVSTDKLRNAREVLAQRIPHSRFELDKKCLTDVVNLFGDAAEYALARNFRERETLFLRLEPEISRCIEELQRAPTHTAIERLLPALSSFRELLKADFERAETTKTSLLLRNVLDNDYYVVNDGCVALRLLLTSRDESAPPIEAIGLVLDGGQGEPCHSPEPLHGGQSREIELTIRPSHKQIKDTTFTVNVRVEYRTRGGTAEKSIAFAIPVRLGTQPFSEINNPYERYAGGNPVDDEAMFFGRKTLVERIIRYLSTGSLGQCFMLYGQKRSGKSSVIKQVEKKLQSPVFFVSVTAGTFTPGRLWVSFVRMLLQQIEFRLEDEGHTLPSSWPSETHRENNPLEAVQQVLRYLARQDRRIAIAVDEFTYIYENAQNDVESFMRGWKALLQQQAFNAVVIGQDTMPRFKRAYPNEFVVAHDVRLTYLERAEAERLASVPIPFEGATRYRGQAAHRLFDLTAGSPFFLQIACDRLVQHLNMRKAAFVTEADVEHIGQTLTVTDPLPMERFDALVTAAGEKVATVPKENLWALLARIARESLHSGWCYRDTLKELPRSDDAIADLIDRDILIDDVKRVRIRVGLFAAWLRANGANFQ